MDRKSEDVSRRPRSSITKDARDGNSDRGGGGRDEQKSSDQRRRVHYDRSDLDEKNQMDVIVKIKISLGAKAKSDSLGNKKVGGCWKDMVNIGSESRRGGEGDNLPTSTK